jgi:hypothetical protein
MAADVGARGDRPGSTLMQMPAEDDFDLSAAGVYHVAHRGMLKSSERR